MKILVTGGAGFIGSALIRYIIKQTSNNVINVDKLTYAGNLSTLSEVSDNARYTFLQCDICDVRAMNSIFERHKPDSIIHLAAESHVDTSIDNPNDFIQTNIIGTFNLLQLSRNYYTALNQDKKASFRFLHVSTDEVYGDLGNAGEMSSERTAYKPSNPYSASKASSDHLVRAWGRTYGLPTIVTNCSNNYGPYQLPEKLIPKTIINALSGKAIPIYGDGKQIRDWLYVEDHVRALYALLTQGIIGETYNIGGHNEHSNITVVNKICSVLDECIEDKPRNLETFKQLITLVKDRAGHDRRYAINASKINQELDWTPKETFESGINKTVLWFIDNKGWWSDIVNKI